MTPAYFLIDKNKKVGLILKKNKLINKKKSLLFFRHDAKIHVAVPKVFALKQYQDCSSAVEFESENKVKDMKK